MSTTKYLIGVLIVVVTGLAFQTAMPLFAQSGTLPSSVEIRPTLCPCEIVLLDAPTGVSGFLAEFTDSAAKVVAGPNLVGAGGNTAPSSTEWIFVPGGGSTQLLQVTVREIWQVVWDDLLDELGPGRDVVILTHDIPVTASLTRLIVDDDDGTRIVTWP